MAKALNIFSKEGSKNLWERIKSQKGLIPESDFKEGQIIKMDPGCHTKNLYYVEILFFNKLAKKGETVMQTNIPGHHSLRMIRGENWEYHHKRMTIVGRKEDFGELLLNQKLD